MVQRKVANKLSIKPLLLKSDSQSPTLTPPSPKPHDHHLKKIMKKPRPTTTTTRSFNSQSPPPLIKKRTHEAGAGARAKTSPQKQSPNYMKSTTSFDARKEQKTPTPKGNSEKVKPSKTSSLKVVRTLTKNSSFKQLSARRTTCSSTLKDSKFPSYLELSHGGTELEGNSVMKVCPYNYCSLNGHHHGPVPPLRCFMSARRRALKNQKSFKLGCLSPRQTKIAVKKNEKIVGEKADMDVTPVTPVMEEEQEENEDFFVEIYSKDREDNLEYSAMDWEEGYCSSSSCVDDRKSSKLPEIEEQTQKIEFDGLYSGLQELYDEKSVSSAWSESEGDYDYESASLHQETKINHQNEMDEDENTGIEEAKTDEVQALDIPTGESETLPDFGRKSAERTESTDKHHTTVIYNIIQYNISIFINGEKTENSETDKPVKVVTVQVPGNSGEENQKVSDEIPASVEDFKSVEQLDTSCLTYTQEEYDENQVNSMDFESDKYSESDEQREITSDEKPEISGEELPESVDEEPATRSEEKPAISGEEMPESSVNLKQSTRIQKTEKVMEESGEYNLRGPNFLPEVADPDAETVDLKHQEIDERKNAEEWMVDFALQQAVTTLAPARKKKVALLVEAFEKVTPTPKYESHNRHASKAFTNARPMQACS